MNINFEKANGFGIILGIGGLIFAGWQAKRTEDMAKKLGVALTDLEKSTPVEIKDDIVEKAIQNATDREVKSAVNDAVRSVKSDVHKTVESEVKKEVNAALSMIKSETAEAISKQVALIDEGALQNEVTRRAEEKLLKKFDSSLDGVLNEARDECRRRLSSVTKSWESIADWAETLLPRRNNVGSGNGMTFRIGE